jgi:hypothetical protein
MILGKSHIDLKPDGIKGEKEYEEDRILESEI